MDDLRPLLLSPRGRIGRRSYWRLIALLIAGGTLLSLVPFFGPILSLPLTWPFACVTAKRLHDADRRAWPVPVVCGLNLAAGLMAFAATMLAVEPAGVLTAFALAGPVLLLSGIATTAALALVLVAGLAAGSRSGNRFGEPEAMPLTFAALLGTD